MSFPTITLPTGALGWYSKVKLGDNVYAIKDAALRAMLDSAATKEAVTEIIVSGEGANNDHAGVPTVKAVLDYLENAIQGLTGAMHFAGVTDPEDGETFAERVEALYDNASPEAGDIVIDGTAEYVYDGSDWKELGDEGVYATKGELEEALADLEIAGVEVGADGAITAQELQSALGLGNFAYVNTGSASVTTFDGATVTIPAATYSVSGTAISVPLTFSSLDITNNDISVESTAATVSINVLEPTSGSFTGITTVAYDKVSSIAVSAAAPAEGQTANYTPAGSVALPSFTGTFTAATTSVATVTDAGTAYSITDGSVAKSGSDQTSAFATSGLTATMGSGDDAETLIFTAASTSNAVVSTAGITYTAPVLSGALPTFSSAVVATGGTVGVAANGDATFTGSSVVVAAAANFTSTAANTESDTIAVAIGTTSVTKVVPAQAITNVVSVGTLSVTPEVATWGSAAPSNASVTISAATITVDAATSAKTITVSPVNS